MRPPHPNVCMGANRKHWIVELFPNRVCMCMEEKLYNKHPYMITVGYVFALINLSLPLKIDMKQVNITPFDMQS